MCRVLTKVVVGGICLLFEAIKVERTIGAFARPLVYSASLPLLFFNPVLWATTDNNTTGLRAFLLICSSELELIIRSNQLAKLS